ncbi:hypothetical protein BDY19DRAFT_948238, partial [Irpex rosettiformis]
MIRTCYKKTKKKSERESPRVRKSYHRHQQNRPRTLGDTAGRGRGREGYVNNHYFTTKPQGHEDEERKKSYRG